MNSGCAPSNSGCSDAHSACGTPNFARRDANSGCGAPNSGGGNPTSGCSDDNSDCGNPNSDCGNPNSGCSDDNSGCADVKILRKTANTARLTSIGPKKNTSRGISQDLIANSECKNSCYGLKLVLESAPLANSSRLNQQYPAGHS